MSLRQLISSTLPPYIPFVKLERKTEVENKVLSVEEKENLFICGGICSLCAYHEEDNLRVLTPEETLTFHMLIQDEECNYFCESCFKVVIQMIELSKGIATLNSKLAQSVTCIKAVLRIKPSHPKLSSSDLKSEVEAISINESNNEEIAHPSLENIDIEFDVKVEDEEDVEMIPVDDEENIENEKIDFYYDTFKRKLWNRKNTKKSKKIHIHSQKVSGKKSGGHREINVEPEQQIESDDEEEMSHPPIEIEFDIKEEDDEEVEIKPGIQVEDVESNLKTFSSVQKIIIKEKELSRETDTDLQCNICMKILSAKIKLEYHKQSIHPEIFGHRPTYDCHHCHKPLVSRRSLDKHIKRYKNGQCPSLGWKCPMCRFDFTSKQSLDRHLKNSCKRHDPITFNQSTCKV